MRSTPLAIYVFSLRRSLPASLLCAFSLALLWAGFGLSELLPLPRMAVAESVAAKLHAAPSAISPKRAELLQSSVDSIALGLGGALDTISAEPPRQAALARALSRLTFELGSGAYFTAWEGTRIIHSPLTPDVAGVDFSDTRDERGSAFVRLMEIVAGSGGGFIRVSLPPQLPRRMYGGSIVGGDTVSIPLSMESAAAKGHEEAELLSADIMERAVAAKQLSLGRRMLPESVLLQDVDALKACIDGSAGLVLPESIAAADTQYQSCGPGKRTFSQSAAVEQVVYIRLIPQSNWHIAAFMPVELTPEDTEGGFSALWSAEIADKSELSSADEGLRSGLRVSALSLAGLAGLIMLPARARPVKDEDEQASQKQKAAEDQESR
jgi:hypothetical protein